MSLMDSITKDIRQIDRLQLALTWQIYAARSGISHLGHALEELQPEDTARSTLALTGLLEDMHRLLLLLDKHAMAKAGITVKKEETENAASEIHDRAERQPKNQELSGTGQ
jgi:hypothetical protein